MAGTSINVKNFRTEIPGALDAEGETWEFPPVFSTNAHKKATVWRIYVRVVDPAGEFMLIDDDWFDSTNPVPGRGWIKVDSGLVGGKIKDSSATIVPVGKNIGRASATNAWTQSLRDAFGAYNRQLKKGTAAPAKSSTELFPPMLAQVWGSSPGTKISPSAESPLFMQRKYNGVRVVATLERVNPADPANPPTWRVILYSRHRNLYPGFPYLRAELLPALAEFWESGRKIYLDGEIYKHGAALQDISGAARRDETTRERADDVKYDYMIYDCFIPTEPDIKFTERRELLESVFDGVDDRARATGSPSHLHLVDTAEVIDEHAIRAFYDQAIADEYEGAMIRLDAPYEYSYNDRHSRVLLKMKPSFDHEFPIVGWSADGVGKAAGALMIICAHGGKQFPVTPAMEIPERVALARKMPTVEENGKTHYENHWQGKPLIVTFDERSKDGLPLRARTKMQIRTWD